MKYVLRIHDVIGNDMQDPLQKGINIMHQIDVNSSRIVPRETSPLELVNGAGYMGAMLVLGALAIL